jgi:hypothetical protein
MRAALAAISDWKCRILMSRDSTNCACGSGAVTRRIGSLAKNTVPSGMAWTSPVKRNWRRDNRAGFAEPAGALEPADLGRREAKIFQEIERLLEPGGQQKSAPRRQCADK